MNKLIRSLPLLAALAFGPAALLAQPAVKLVIVDMAKVFEGHYESEEANVKFRDAEQKAQETAEEMKKQGQIIVDEYKELSEQAKNTLLTAEARAKAEADAQKKLEDIQRKQNEIQTFLQNSQRSLQQRINNHRDLLLEKITKVVIEIAKGKGATLVIDKSGPSMYRIPVVLYADSGYDITEEVLTAVNKDRPVAPPAVTPPAAGTPAPTTPAPAPATPAPKPATPAKPATPETRK